MTDELTDKQRCFVQEYLVDLNATQAAIRAGYSEKTACEQGSRLLAHVKVSEAIRAAMQERAKRTEISQDDVLRLWWSMANVDVNDIMQYRRLCCRHCWGEGHEYQWRDRDEYEEHLARIQAMIDQRKPEDDSPEPEFPSDDGGYGFRSTKPPHPECPKCEGEGHGDVHIKDTRSLQGGAAMLYDGVKVTERGIEIKTQDRAKALDQVARHLGMFKDRVEHTGKDGGPIETVDRTPTESARRIAFLLAQAAKRPAK